jgi:hypothetical protein
MKKFRVRCYLKNYQRGNDTIRKRHKLIFKDTVNHHYDFPATNELLETLEFDFVNRLKSGLWTKLPHDWLSNIRKKIQSAMDSSIKSIKLVPILGTANILPGNDEVVVYGQTDSAGNVGDMLATCRFVADLDQTCVSGPTHKSKIAEPTQNLCVGKPLYTYTYLCT